MTDKLADARMDALDVPRTGGKQADMPTRMACRFITIPDVDFVSHKAAARDALITAFGKQPVTMRVLCRLQQNGSRAWYVQVSLDVPSGFEEMRPATQEAGVLVVDFNARGLAWCAVKPDGNRLAGEQGFIPWHLKGKTKLERRQIIGRAAAQLIHYAQRLKMAVAMERLDFSTKRQMMRAGSVNRDYNDMLGSLPSSQFAERHDERLVFSHLPDNQTQSTKALAGATWRDVAWGLGENRRLWGNRFRDWFLDRVETASCSKEPPALALSPPG